MYVVILILLVDGRVLRLAVNILEVLRIPFPDNALADVSQDPFQILRASVNIDDEHDTMVLGSHGSILTSRVLS